jgi:hypothetical protein
VGKPVNQNGFSDHFPITMTVTEIDQLDWPWSVTAYICQRFCDRQPTPQKIYTTSMGCEEGLSAERWNWLVWDPRGVRP